MRGSIYHLKQQKLENFEGDLTAHRERGMNEEVRFAHNSHYIVRV